MTKQKPIKQIISCRPSSDNQWLVKKIIDDAKKQVRSESNLIETILLKHYKKDTK